MPPLQSMRVGAFYRAQLKVLGTDSLSGSRARHSQCHFSRTPDRGSTPQVVVVSEPAVVKEILHRRDLDKSAILHTPITKVLPSVPPVAALPP